MRPLALASFKSEKIFLYLFFDFKIVLSLTIDGQSGSIYSYTFAHRGDFALFYGKITDL